MLKNNIFLANTIIFAVFLFSTGANAQQQRTTQQNCHVYFTHDSHALTSESIFVLNDLVHYFRADKPRSILIVGHTDRTGRAAYNIKLSKRRALAVTKFLKKELGLKNYLFQTTWHGEERLPFPTKDGVPEHFNRCVKVSFSIKEK